MSVAVNERLECHSIGCLQPPAGLLEGYFYCRGHFIVTCYAKLEYCSDLLRNRTFSEETFEAIRRFIGECTQQTARLSETARDLNSFERARLLDILFYASDIGSHMRRSPRKTLTIPVRLHDGAFTRDQRRRVLELELELHLSSDRERLLRADEDAALTHVNGIPLDELLEGLALEFDLERDRRALALSGIWIGHVSITILGALPD